MMSAKDHFTKLIGSIEKERSLTRKNLEDLKYSLIQSENYIEQERNKSRIYAEELNQVKNNLRTVRSSTDDKFVKLQEKCSKLQDELIMLKSDHKTAQIQIDTKKSQLVELEVKNDNNMDEKETKYILAMSLKDVELAELRARTEAAGAACREADEALRDQQERYNERMVTVQERDQCTFKTFEMKVNEEREANNRLSARNHELLGHMSSIISEKSHLQISLQDAEYIAKSLEGSLREAEEKLLVLTNQLRETIIRKEVQMCK